MIGSKWSREGRVFMLSVGALKLLMVPDTKMTVQVFTSLKSLLFILLSKLMLPSKTWRLTLLQTSSYVQLLNMCKPQGCHLQLLLYIFKDSAELFYMILRDHCQIWILIFCKLEWINQLLFPIKLSEMNLMSLGSI